MITLDACKSLGLLESLQQFVEFLYYKRFANALWGLWETPDGTFKHLHD